MAWRLVSARRRHPGHRCRRRRRQCRPPRPAPAPGRLWPGGRRRPPPCPEGLPVQAALTGDHQVRSFQQAVKAHGVQHGFDRHLQPAPSSARMPYPSPPAAPAPVYSAGPGPSAGPPRPPGEISLRQAAAPSPGPPPSGAEHRAGAPGTAQGVVNVAHGDQLHAVQAGGAAAAVQGGNLIQGAACGDEGGAVRPQEADPQCGGSTGAASLVALPPRPTIIVRAPAWAARRISCPTP